MRHHHQVARAVVLVLAALLPMAAPMPVAAEAPYRVTTFALSPMEWHELSWHGWPSPNFPAKPPVDGRGIPMHRWGDGKLYYWPGEIAINSMKRLDAYVRRGYKRQLDQTLIQARKLRHVAHQFREAWWLPFKFDYPPRDQVAPWYNAMSQGLLPPPGP